jgi:hypothetical protein
METPELSEQQEQPREVKEDEKPPITAREMAHLSLQARMRNLTPERRREIARKAITARWKYHRAESAEARASAEVPVEAAPTPPPRRRRRPAPAA